MKHQSLLDSFGGDLERLKNTPLHPSLVAAVGGNDAIHSIALTGVNLISACGGSSNIQSVHTSPLSPTLSSSRIRGSSISEDIDTIGVRLSGSSLRVVASGHAVSPVFKLPINMGQQLQPQQQQQQQQQHQQHLQSQSQSQSQQIQQRKKSFCLDNPPGLSGGGSGNGTQGFNQGSHLEVGSFDEAYPFQTGELTISRGDDTSEPTEATLTLYDCIPVDKEKAWAMQCNEVHLKVEEKLSQLLLVFKNVSLGLDDISVLSLDTGWLQSVFKSLEDNLHDQVGGIKRILRY